MIFTKAWLIAGVMSSALAAASIRDAVASYYRVAETIEVSE